VNKSETARRSPKTNLEGQAALVIALVLDGLSDAKVAEALGASPAGVTLFRHRHIDEINTQRAVRNAGLVDNWIADKQERLSRLRGIFERLEEQVKTAEGRDLAALAREARGALMDAAAVLGQLPRPNVNIDARRQQVVFQFQLDRPERTNVIDAPEYAVLPEGHTDD